MYYLLYYIGTCFKRYPHNRTPPSILNCLIYIPITVRNKKKSKHLKKLHINSEVIEWMWS